MCFFLNQPFSSLNVSPFKLFFTHAFSTVGMLPPWNCFLPAFPQIEWFPFEIVFTSISAIRMLPSISAVRMLSPSSCTDMCKNACVNKYIYIYIIPIWYIEYRIDNFGFKNISRNRWKKNEYFHWGLYSIYVIFQGIGSLPCIRIYIIYVIPFGE